MTITATKQDKQFLINILQHRLKWSESSLKSFTEESLNELYQYILEGYTIGKSRARNTQHSVISIRIPNLIMDNLYITRSEWFDILVNIHKKQIILHRDRKNKLKLQSDHTILLPYRLAEKNLIKPNDDTAIIAKGDKIIIKSFTYFQ